MNNNLPTQRVIRSKRVHHPGHKTLIGPKSTGPTKKAGDHIHTPNQLVVSRVENNEDGSVTAIHVRCQCGAELIIDCLH